MLEDELGPGVAEALARTADQLRADMDAPRRLRRRWRSPTRAVEDGLSVAALRRPAGADPRPACCGCAAVAAGAPAGELFHQHVVAVDALVTDWHGQKWVDLPGHLRAVRRDGVLAFDARGPPRPTAFWAMDASHVENDLVNVLFTEAQIQDRLDELAAEIEADYEGKDLLIVGILRGAVMVMADLARALPPARRDGLDGDHAPTAPAPSPAASSGSSRTSTPTSPGGTCSSSTRSSTPASP